MIVEVDNKKPNIEKSVFIASDATIVGDVTIAANSSVWFKAVLRGDINSIKIGEHTNIQDLCMIHVPTNLSALIGDNVTVGHKALLHGCTVGNNCLVGMGSIVMDGVEIGENCIIGAGSLVTQGTKIPPRSLVIGSPAKIKRALTDEEIAQVAQSAKKYFEFSRMYI